MICSEVTSAGKWPPDHSHVQKHHRMICVWSPTFPPTPLPFAISDKTKQGQRRGEKGTFAQKAACCSDWNKLFKLLTYTPRLLGTDQVFLAGCAHTLGLGRRTTVKYLVLLLKSKASSVSAVACVCLMDASWRTVMYAGTKEVPGPSRALGSQIYLHTKSCRAWEGKPVQTTGPHPSLTALLNELAAAQRIPQPIHTGLSGLSGTEPNLLNEGQRSSVTQQQCFLSLPGLTRFVPCWV